MGSGWVPGGSGRFRVVPGGFRVVPAGSGRFRRVPGGFRVLPTPLHSLLYYNPPFVGLDVPGDMAPEDESGGDKLDRHKRT